VDLGVHSPPRLHRVVLNHLSTGAALPLLDAVVKVTRTREGKNTSGQEERGEQQGD
jgi:hypothetical protein